MIELNDEEIESVTGGMSIAPRRIGDGVAGVLAVGIGGAIVVATSPAWVTAVGAAFVVGGAISLFRAFR
jgi:predicted phage tail protein